MVLLTALVFAGSGFLSGRASALPPFPGIVKTAYLLKPGGKLDSAGCDLCHAGGTDANHLNLYGKQVQSILPQTKPKTLTAALLHSLDAKDADGDGFSNREELEADTLPGDPASKPAGQPKPVKNSASSSPETSAAPNPFGPQALFYPKHAQHPIVIHFPIALFMISLFFDLMGYRRQNPALIAAGYFNLVVAAVTSLLAVATGLLAWIFAFDRQPLQGNLLYHLILGVTTTVLICTLWAIRTRQSKDSARPLGKLYVFLAALALAVITLTGHIGGILTGIVQ